MTDFAINLTDPGYVTDPFFTTARAVSIVVNPDAWGDAVIEMEWTIDDEQAVWATFSPAVRFDASVAARHGISVAGVSAIRLKVVTADTDADEKAIAQMEGASSAASPLDDSGGDYLRAMGINTAGRFIDLSQISHVNKFGANDDIDTGSNEDIWDFGSQHQFQSSAQSLEALSSSANDSASGTGANTIRVLGVDDNYNEIYEDVTLNGTTAVNLTQKFLRANCAYVLTAGTDETNDGDITVRIVSGGDEYCQINEGNGQTLMCIYTIPAGKTGYMTSWSSGIYGAPSSGVSVDLKLRRRTEGGVIRFVSRGGVIDSGTSSSHRKWLPPVTFNEKEDVWVSASVDTSNTSVFSEFDIVLVDN